MDQVFSKQTKPEDPQIQRSVKKKEKGQNHKIQTQENRLGYSAGKGSLKHCKVNVLE